MQYLFLAFIGINLLGFVFMYIDKKRAINHKYRIKEATLWQIAIFGGAIGSGFGMKLFRHKTKHKLFLIGIPLLAIIHIALIIFVNSLLNN